MILRPALLLLALAASGLAWGDAPEMPARLSYVEGELAFQGAADASPSALPDRPLVPGDRLTTAADSRAELAFGAASLRLDQKSELSVVALDETIVRLQLTAGAASLHLRELLEDESFELATPAAALAIREPGEYRVDVAADGATDLTVRAGAAEVATAGGPVRVAGGQRVRVTAGAAFASLAAPQPADAFDDWVLERELQFAQAEPPRFEQPDGDYREDETLARYGEWYEEPSYGRVWMPSYAYGGYDPFRYGQWQRTGFGWSWYDPMPWGAYTLHHGRWAYLHHQNRWCWVPERRNHRRHVAQDTRPFGRPNNNDDRRANDRRDRQRDASPRRDDNERRPVAASAGLSRHIDDADRQPVLRRAIETAKTTRKATLVPSTNGDSSPPPRSAPVARQSAPASQDSATTKMRPSRPAEAQSPAVSRPTSSAKGVLARQQIP